MFKIGDRFEIHDPSSQWTAWSVGDFSSPPVPYDGDIIMKHYREMGGLTGTILDIGPYRHFLLGLDENRFGIKYTIMTASSLKKIGRNLFTVDDDHLFILE